MLTNHLSAIHGLVGVGESAAGPTIHAQVEVAHTEDGRLESLGVVEGAPSVLEALFNGARDEHDVLCIAVAALVEHGNVGLLRPCRQTRRRANPDHVPKHGGDFCKVGQSDEFLHQRNARPGGGGHASTTGPTGTQDHACCRQFIFGLNHGHVGVSFVVRSKSWNVADDAFRKRRRGRDRVPGEELNAAVVGTEGCRFVSFDEELRRRNLSRFNSVGVGLGQVLLAVVPAQSQGGDVEFHGRGFALELLGDCRLEAGLVNAQQFGKNADVNDVRDQLGDFGVDLAGQRAHRYRIGNDVLPVDGLLLGVAVPNHDRSGLEGSEVVFPRGRIHEHLDVGPVAGCLIAPVGETHDVPRWQAGNIGGKEVLSTDGNAHVKE